MLQVKHIVLEMAEMQIAGDMHFGGMEWLVREFNSNRLTFIDQNSEQRKTSLCYFYFQIRKAKVQKSLSSEKSYSSLDDFELVFILSQNCRKSNFTHFLFFILSKNIKKHKKLFFQ